MKTETVMTRSFTSREIGYLIQVLLPIAEGRPQYFDKDTVQEMARVALDAVVAFPGVEIGK